MSEYVCETTDDYPDAPWGDDDYSGTVERRERVVRCRDCRKAVPVGGGLLCDAWAYWDGTEWMRPDTEPDGFCWKGEMDGDR